MMLNEIGAQQGWQCPICKRVYSPSTMMCFYCGGERKTGISTDGTDIDWTKQQSVTVPYYNTHPSSFCTSHSGGEENDE